MACRIQCPIAVAWWPVVVATHRPERHGVEYLPKSLAYMAL